MCGSMVDIQSPTAEIRRGKKEEERHKSQGKYIMVCPITYGDHNNDEVLSFRRGDDSGDVKREDIRRRDCGRGRGQEKGQKLKRDR